MIKGRNANKQVDKVTDISRVSIEWLLVRYWFKRLFFPWCQFLTYNGVNMTAGKIVSMIAL